MPTKEKLKIAPISLQEAIEPLMNCSISFSRQRMLLNQMFAHSVSNAPSDEVDNFTAKQLSPFFIALSETLENLERFNVTNPE